MPFAICRYANARTFALSAPCQFDCGVCAVTTEFTNHRLVQWLSNLVPIMQTFGRWHSGEFANGTAGAALGRISWVRPRLTPVAQLWFLLKSQGQSHRCQAARKRIGTT